MDINEILGLVSRWAHVLTAAIMIGGTFFMRFSYVPAKLAHAPSDEFAESVRKGWAKLVMMCTLFLLVSGLYNAAMKAMGFHLGMTYNVLLLVKILLAFAAFYFAARLSGRSAGAVKFREREKHWLNILCLIMLAIVLIAGYMKISSVGFEPKIRGESSETQPAVTEVYRSSSSKNSIASSTLDLRQSANLNLPLRSIT